MKKLKILLIILIIINIIFASILTIDIQLFKSPDIIVEVNILEVNSEEVTIGSNIKIFNPNGFDIIVSDLEVISKTEDGKNLGYIVIKGGNIKPNDEKEFDSVDTLKFESDNFEIIQNTVSTRVGINILGFITKTIPLKITAIASFEEIFKDIDLPDVNIIFNFDNLTQEGIKFSAAIDLFNPTNFEFNVDEISLDINNEKNENVGNIEINGGKIQPKSSEVFSSQGTIQFYALDSEILLINVSGIAGAKIAGINKNISFYTDASFDIPDIKSFIFENDTVDIGLPVQFKFTPFGIMTTVGLKVHNPSEIPLVAENLVCSISRSDGEEVSVLGQENMENCEITPKETICIKTEILIPYLKYLASGYMKIFPDWIILSIEGNFSIAGTRQAFPISLNAYVDPHFLRDTEFVIPQS